MTYEMSLMEIITLLLTGYVLRVTVEELKDWMRGDKPE